MYRFRFRLIPSLPRLAWCAQFSAGKSEILVEHGPWVESGDTFFVDGAWDAPFDDGRIDLATVVLGSGGRTIGDEAVFYTTTHTMERLQSLRVGDKLFISNSFAYLLKAAGDGLDVNYRYYERDFMTFLRGRQHAARTVPTELGRHVQLYYGERIAIGPNLAIRTEPYPGRLSFDDYDAYVSAVDALLRRVDNNATAASRKIRYQPVSTLSTGYDSPACTVFAKKVGCRKAITIVDARSDYNPYGRTPDDISDSGAEIAKHLDINLAAFRRDAYLGRDDCPEAEFIATGNGGDDVVICAAEEQLASTMLFTGFLGDTLWGLDPISASASRDYTYKFPAGGTLGEFRIRTGFIHVPVPLLTYASQQELVSIARSDQMAQWRVGGDYDRPIPRRLVETSGVPRAIYAQEKKAVTQPFWLPIDRGSIRTMMSAASYASMSEYASSPAVSAKLSIASKIKTLFSPLLLPALASRLNWYSSILKKTLGIRLIPELRADQFQTCILFSNPAGMKFHWAIDRVSDRYQTSEYR